MKTGQLMKEELKKKGLILRFVADKTGIPYDSLIHYLNDYRPFPESKVRCVCLTFDLDPKIFGLRDNNKNQRKAI